MKKEFTEQELYERMMYVLYCTEAGINIKSCSSHKAWTGFVKSAQTHCGSCTSVAMSCNRCRLFSIEVEAQNIVDTLMDGDGLGRCGKKCLTECEGAGERKDSTDKNQEQ